MWLLLRVSSYLSSPSLPVQVAGPSRLGGGDSCNREGLWGQMGRSGPHSDGLRSLPLQHPWKPSSYPLHIVLLPPRVLTRHLQA